MQFAEGTVLKDRYEIIRLLSEKGGMGIIYQATDLTFHNTVVIKQSRFTGASLQMNKAFEREARLLNGLRHSALPHVLDYFSSDGAQFLVMQFIPGKDLGELLEARLRHGDGPFPLGQVLHWADQLLDVLHYLHAHEPSIVHRDIKPQNLKLTPRGEIVLLDFGLAKGASGEMSIAEVSLHGYTPSYAPLEQIRGTGTDARSDLYSLAATIYNLLTARTPADAVTRATERLNNRPDPLAPAAQVSGEVPAAVSEVLERATALNIDERPPSARAMQEALRRAAAATQVGEVPTLPPPVPAPSHPIAPEPSDPPVKPVGRPVDKPEKKMRQRVSRAPAKRRKPTPADDSPVDDSPVPESASAPASSSAAASNPWPGRIVTGIGVLAVAAGSWYYFGQDALPTAPVQMTIATPTPTVTPVAQTSRSLVPIARQIKVSAETLQSMAVTRVQPVYPPLARAARIQGVVLVEVTIAEDGRVSDARIVDGPALLREQALQAARKWTFKPMRVSGIPMKMQGTLTFNFKI